MKLQDLDELRVFRQIVESGSLSAAAKALKLPPTTVSRRLAMLEDRLGTKLMYRSTRSMSLSEPGQRLLKSARVILQEVADVEVALEQEEKELSGIVRIGVLSLLSEDLLDVLAPLLRAHPNLQIEVQVADRSINPISSGVDVAIYGGALTDSSLIAKKLLDIDIMLAASKTYLEAAGPPKTVDALHSHQFLNFGKTKTTLHLTDSEGGLSVAHLEARMVSNDARTLRDALLAGLGIGATSSRVLNRHETLQRVLPEFSLASVPLYAVYPAAMQRSERLQTIVTYLKEALDKAGTRR
ncbi:MAG: LysR family transcriptional regulator [Deltaproteobacteria bacterium]|nr:LysR family transcriptional regulator [Deltaproteobacteria bacterium]